MNQRWLWIVCGGLLLVLAAGILSGRSSTDQPTASAVQAAPPKMPGLRPVEDDMHEFMEYAFEPGYKRLKANLAAEPDAAGWKAIKGDALTLAEAGNLLLMRLPEEEALSWARHAAAVRQSAGKLYTDAKKKNYAAARRSWEATIANCNHCHDVFAEGKYQLKP